MIQIVGFGEVVLLEKGLVTRKEMRVRLQDGTEHGVEVPEEVMKQLLSLYANSQKKGAVTLMVRKQPPKVVEPEPGPEPGEMTFGDLRDDTEEPPAPEPAAKPGTPRFLQEDEDGKQI